MHERILCPTDGSDGAKAALEYAIEYAKAFDASLHLLYVVEKPIAAVEDGAPDVLEALEADGKRVLDEAREMARSAGVESLQASVIAGQPYRQIAAYIDEKNVDLVVMGTHGRDGIEQHLLGSVTERVIKSTDRPVLSIHPDGTATEN